MKDGADSGWGGGWTMLPDVVSQVEQPRESLFAVPKDWFSEDSKSFPAGPLLLHNGSAGQMCYSQDHITGPSQNCTIDSKALFLPVQFRNLLTESHLRHGVLQSTVTVTSPFYELGHRLISMLHRLCHSQIHENLLKCTHSASSQNTLQ